MGSEIFDAVAAGDAERVAELVAARPELAAARGDDGLSILLFARYRSNGPIVQALLAAKPELDAFEAAALGETDRLRSLIDADPGVAAARSVDGFTALHLAAFFAHLEATRLLLDAGAEVDAVSSNPMRVTPLHSAAAAGDVAICRLLVERGADVNAVQRDSFRPIHAAAENGDETLVDLFLAAGAGPGARLDDGRTAADLAAAKGHDALVERLRG